jgi:hypothetical protein
MKTVKLSLKMAMKVKVHDDIYVEMADGLLEHIGGILGPPVWNYLLASYLFLSIVVTVHRIITIRNMMTIATNLSPWPLFLSTTTTKMKNRTPATKRKTSKN